MNQSQRFLSLDVFRGMTVCFMIIVNTPGSGAKPFAMLEHAAWHGFTPTDLVFPSFLFAVGNAMSFSMRKFAQMENPAVLMNIFKRVLLIFLLGYLMYWFPFFSQNENGGISFLPIANTRIFGVLQRIAICYGIASLLIHYLSTRYVILISMLFLIGYWVALLVFGDSADPFSMTANAGQQLDLFLLGDKHLYHGEGIAFDPEGILSTIPACVNVIIGYYAGKFIQERGKGYETVAKLMLAGGVLIVISLCLNPVFPINKKLWTSTFVLLTCGLDLLIIGALIYSIEISASTRWTGFFTVFGKNPLFIYLLSELLLSIIYVLVPGSDFRSWVNNNFFQVIAPGPLGSLLFAICFMLVCWLIGYMLDKRKIYIRV
ncbi:acyltransferase family protein [Pedobacter africanus]|uniref:Predicted acyltransferase n=1 Tax=Pedobacter africanus TaxID=151894 RepID=A0A1W2DXS2_9SPHI|nr:heparan-alpha-glucosaminide N-acetyltransferase domain-containing protein [Pedobacter africanus]SMD02243.1 Predicted acyltransferase [Pedobacter africanus]